MSSKSTLHVTIVLPSGRRLGPFELSRKVTSVEAYEQLIDLIGVPLVELTDATHLSHAFWFDVKSLDGLHPAEDVGNRLNLDEESFMYQVEEIVGRASSEHQIVLCLRTHHKNVFIDTDAGKKQVEISKCDFAVSVEDAMHVFENLFHHMLPPNSEVQKVGKNFHLRDRVLGNFPWHKIVDWKDANGMKRLAFLTNFASSVQDVIDLDDGFVWQGNHVIDTRVCIGPCPKSHTGGTKTLVDAHRQGFKQALLDYERIHGEIDATLRRRAEKEMEKVTNKWEAYSSDSEPEGEVVSVSDAESDSDTSSNISGGATPIGWMARQ